MAEDQGSRFVRARNGTIFQRTEMNTKSRSMVEISDFEALKFFLDEGYSSEQLSMLGLKDQYDMYLSRKEQKEAAAKSTKQAPKADS